MNLINLPQHMHEAVRLWVERAEPHPLTMGGFFHAVLTNDLVGAFCRADHINAVCMRDWALFLYNELPSPCWGNEAKLLAWYDAHHPKVDAEFPEVGEETAEAAAAGEL